jgi:hypothetical protein
MAFGFLLDFLLNQLVSFVFAPDRIVKAALDQTPFQVAGNEKGVPSSDAPPLQEADVALNPLAVSGQDKEVDIPDLERRAVLEERAFQLRYRGGVILLFVGQALPENPVVRERDGEPVIKFRHHKLNLAEDIEDLTSLGEEIIHSERPLFRASFLLLNSNHLYDLSPARSITADGEREGEFQGGS